MLTDAELDALRRVDIETVDKAALVDIRTVRVDASATDAERARQFCEQIKNPYVFRVGDVAVKVEYAENGGTLRDALRAYLAMIRE